MLLCLPQYIMNYYNSNPIPTHSLLSLTLPVCLFVLQEFVAQVISLVPQETDRQMLLDMVGDVSAEYVSIAVTAVGYLTRYTMS